MHCTCTVLIGNLLQTLRESITRCRRPVRWLIAWKGCGAPRAHVHLVEKRLWVRLRSGDKHHLRKSAYQKAQISPVSGMNRGLPDLCCWICRFSQVVFFPRAQPHAQSLFLFPIVFGINLIHFSMRKRTVQPEIRSFVSVLRSPVTPFDRRKMKNANCFWECNVFGNGECERSAIQEGRN